MGCVHFARLTDVPVCSETVASQAITWHVPMGSMEPPGFKFKFHWTIM